MSQNPFPREPLTPEEQALARRLGQLGQLGPHGPHGEPSPALDARILAAARAPQARPARRARRWPLALGLAASLVLAVGIAWRLRPLPGPPADEAMTRSVATPTARPIEGADMARKAQPQAGGIPSVPAAAAEPTPSRAAREPAVDDIRTEKTTTSARATTSAPTPSAPMPEPTVVLDAPAPAAAPAIATLPPPPPPPSSPAPVVGAPQPQAAAAATPALPARKAARTAAQAEGDAGFDAAAAANEASGDEPSEDVPPATADAPAVREAWLQRIRELLAEGRSEDARASLKEFLHRYPDARLPDDLRALAK